MKTLIIKYSVVPIVLSILIIAMLFNGTASAQDQIKKEDGIIVTEKGDITVYYDEFTGKYAITVTDRSLLSSLDKRQEEKYKSYFIPFFGGNIYDEDLTDLQWIESWSANFIIVLIREEPENNFFGENGSRQIPFLIDEKRVSKSAYYFKEPSQEIITIRLTPSEWEDIIESENSRYRISGQVFTIDENSKNIMEQILSEHQRIQSDKYKSNKDLEGQKSTRSSPYDLRWEEDLDRSPMVLPLPDNVTDGEAVVSVRFEVFPNGSIGRIIPLIQMNPELEREIMRTLRSWRFTRLPSGVPQEPQWGTITFRFILE